MSSKITIEDSTSKTHLCMFCGEQQLKLSRHLRRNHKDETIVAEAMALKNGSRTAFERIRLKGYYQHNCNVLALGEGELIVVRNPGSKKPFGDASSFLLCPDCLVFFKGMSFAVTTSAVSTKQPSPRNGRNCSLKLGFCCP